MKLHDLEPAYGSTKAPKRLGRGIGSGRGFTNKFRTEYETINISVLNVFEDGEVVGPIELLEYGIINKVLDGIKILGDGELTKKLTVQANKFTATAKEKIEAAGGSCEVI